MIPAIQPFSHSLFCGSFRFVVIMNGNVPAVRHKSFFFLVFPSQIISQELCSGATPPNRTHELVSSTSEKKRRKSHSTRGGGEIRKGKRKFSRFFIAFSRNLPDCPPGVFRGFQKVRQEENFSRSSARAFAVEIVSSASVHLSGADFTDLALQREQAGGGGKKNGGRKCP